MFLITFFLVVYSQEAVFFQIAVFLCFFSCGHPLLNGYGVFEKRTSHEFPIYNVFDRYFYLRHIVISNEYLQPYIWVVPSLFQEPFCSDLEFSSELRFFETSTFSHLFFQRFLVNSQFQLQPSMNSKIKGAATQIFKFTVFLQNRNCDKQLS